MHEEVLLAGGQGGLKARYTLIVPKMRKKFKYLNLTDFTEARTRKNLINSSK
jgi:hypothetical protein